MGCMTHAELVRLHDEARVEMQKIPGVAGVGYGFKMTAGVLTDEVGFIVYVKEKQDRSRLEPAEIIPPRFKGIVTDVRTVLEVTLLDCTDHTKHSPLLGGITITNLKLDSAGNGHVGTLGFFATIDGVSGPRNIVFVSNSHVLMSNGARVGDTIYQPPLFRQLGNWIVDPKADNNPVGSIANQGLFGDHPFTYPGEAQLPYFVDCATVKMDICISTWCHSNCGESFTDQVIDLGINGSNAIMDVARILHTDLNPNTPYVVYKVGQKTGRTVGTVVALDAHVNVPGFPPGHNAIEIMPTQPDCSGILQFVEEGDSGAALINAEGKLVGMIFGHPQDATHALACPIHPVLDVLKVTPVTQANPATGNPAFSNSATTAHAAPPPGVQPAARSGVVPALRQRLEQSEEGTRLIALVEAHSREVVHLVNHKRRVTVTWHRNKGPQFLNEAVINAHDAKHLIPLEIEGVTRETLLRRMVKVLADYGSAGLQAALQLNPGNVVARLCEAGTLHELIDSLAAQRTV
jgi:hypothetical protein